MPGRHLRFIRSLFSELYIQDLLLSLLMADLSSLGVPFVKSLSETGGRSRIQWIEPMSICPDRLRLAREFNDELQRYADLVRRSLDLMERGLVSEVEELRRAGRLAWGTAEEARLAVYRHEANHGCNLRQA